MEIAASLRQQQIDTVLDQLDSLLAREEVPTLDALKTAVSNWPSFEVKILDPRFNSDLTPPFLKAFLELQHQIYVIAALTSENSDFFGIVSDKDKRNLEIKIHVTPGSTNATTNIYETIVNLLSTPISKLGSRHLTKIIYATLLALTLGGISTTVTNAINEYNIKKIETEAAGAAEAQKALKERELIQSIQTANEETNKRIMSLLEKSFDSELLARRASDAGVAVAREFLKAAETAERTEINGVQITCEQAKILRKDSPKLGDQYFTTREVKIIGIIRGANDERVTIDTGKEIYKIGVGYDMFDSKDREDIYNAMKTNSAIWMELKVCEFEGEIRSVEFVRVTDDRTPTSSIRTKVKRKLRVKR